MHPAPTRILRHRSFITIILKNIKNSKYLYIPVKFVSISIFIYIFLLNLYACHYESTVPDTQTPSRHCEPYPQRRTDEAISFLAISAPLSLQALLQRRTDEAISFLVFRHYKPPPPSFTPAPSFAPASLPRFIRRVSAVFLKNTLNAVISFIKKRGVFLSKKHPFPALKNHPQKLCFCVGYMFFD
jgi:hypothetical protein